MLQFHESQTLGNPPRLISINSVWTSSLHITKSTRTCACIPQDHDGCRATAPALAHVWATRLLANSVQPVLTNDSFEPLIASAAWNTRAQPIWFAANDALLWRVVVV
jgi:hypothetical protein